MVHSHISVFTVIEEFASIQYQRINIIVEWGWIPIDIGNGTHTLSKYSDFIYQYLISSKRHSVLISIWNGFIHLVSNPKPLSNCLRPFDIKPIQYRGYTDTYILIYLNTYISGVNDFICIPPNSLTHSYIMARF